MKKIMMVALFALSTGCFAEEDADSGNFFHGVCKNSPSTCTFYVSGVYSGIFYGLAADDTLKTFPEGERKVGICRPDNVTNEQLKDVFVKYLADHPESRHESSVYLAVLSWKKAWPCQRK